MIGIVGTESCVWIHTLSAEGSSTELLATEQDQESMMSVQQGLVELGTNPCGFWTGDSARLLVKRLNLTNVFPCARALGALSFYAHTCELWTGLRTVMVVDMDRTNIEFVLAEIAPSATFQEQVSIVKRCTAPLGGDVFTARLVALISGHLPSLSPQAQDRLRLACEEAKCVLSREVFVSVEVDDLLGAGIDFTNTCTRKAFENACQQEISQIKLILDQEVICPPGTEVIICGESAKMPKLRSELLLSTGQSRIAAQISYLEAAKGLSYIARAKLQHPSLNPNQDPFPVLRE